MMKKFDPKKYFLEPQIAAQRRYEALRAHFVDSMSRKAVAKQFDYTFYSFQALVRDFLQQKINIFVEKKPGPKERRTSDLIKDRIVLWRKKNLASLDIKSKLEEEGITIGVRTIERFLEDEGFEKLPRRSFVQRGLTTKKTVVPDKSKQLDFETLTAGRFKCQVAGIYCYIPYMIQIGLDKLLETNSFPETSQLSSLNSVFSILALKLMGWERLSQVTDFNFDRGLGFFAGLNVLPKSWAISTYSYRIDGESANNFMRNFVSNINNLNKKHYGGETINLDFHSIPHYGDESILDKNWVGARHQAMKSALTLLAQDGKSKMLNYVNANIKRSDASNEILNFVKHWIDVKGVVNETLVFDSKLTSYPMLHQLAEDGIKFLTLRRRGESLIDDAYKIPKEKWEKVDLKIPKRKYNKFLAFDHSTTLQYYIPNTEPKPKRLKKEFDVREIIIKDHGREQPTFIVTNNYDFPLIDAITHYARRWKIENTIADIVHFFSLNALSSPIMIRIHFDVLLTMIADTLYKLMAHDLRGYEQCTSKQLFRKFINTPGKIIVNGNNVIVKMRKNAHTPVLKSNDTFRKAWDVPWWDNKVLTYDWIS